MHLLRLVQRHPKSNEHRTVFDTFSGIYIHIIEGVMRYVISFGIWAAPAILHGSKVTVTKLRDDDSTFLKILHSAINRSTFLQSLETLCMVSLVLKWFGSTESLFSGRRSVSTDPSFRRIRMSVAE
jgi:hypothetical protein